MLLKSKKLADACGITSETVIEDIYMQFINKFKEKKEIVEGVAESFGKFNILEFITEYFDLIEKGQLATALNLKPELSLEDESLKKYNLTELKKIFFLLVRHWHNGYVQHSNEILAFVDKSKGHVNFNVLPINVLVRFQTTHI